MCFIHLSLAGTRVSVPKSQRRSSCVTHEYSRSMSAASKSHRQYLLLGCCLWDFLRLWICNHKPDFLFVVTDA